MDLFFPSQELEPDNRTKNDSRVHTCNLEKKILCIFNVFHDSPPCLQFLLPGSFLPWMKEVSSSSSSSSSSFYSFCFRSSQGRSIVNYMRGRAPLGSAFCLHRMRKTFTRAVCVWRAVCVKVRWICKFYCLPPRLRPSSSPIRCVRIGTLTVNFENVVARHRWRIRNCRETCPSSISTLYHHHVETRIKYRSKRNQISTTSGIEKERCRFVSNFQSQNPSPKNTRSLIQSPPRFSIIICFKINSISKTIVSILRLITIPNNDNQKARLWSARSKGKQVACTKPCEQTVGEGGQARQRVPRSWQTFIPGGDARERSCVKGLRFAYRCAYRHIATLRYSLSPPPPPNRKWISPRREHNRDVQRAPSLLRFAREAEVNKRGRATALSRLIGKDLLARACGGSGLKLKFDCRLPGTVFAAIVSPSALHRGKSRHDGEGLVETTWRPTMFADRPTREILNERVCVRARVHRFKTSRHRPIVCKSLRG